MLRKKERKVVQTEMKFAFFFYDYMARCISFLGRISGKALKPLILRHTTQNIRNTSMAINMEERGGEQ